MSNEYNNFGDTTIGSSSGQISTSTYTPNKMRKFYIPESASVADPAWIIACYEVVDWDPNSPLISGTYFDPSFCYGNATMTKKYTDFEPLKKLISKIEDQRRNLEGTREEGVASVLQTLGISPETYIELQRAKMNGSVVQIFAKIATTSDLEIDNSFVEPQPQDPVGQAIEQGHLNKGLDKVQLGIEGIHKSYLERVAEKQDE